MERFKNDKSRLYEIIKSMEKVQATLTAIRFEDFIKGAAAREEIASQLRRTGGIAKQLSEDFKLSYEYINWNFLQELAFVTYNADDKEIGPYTLWYMVENDLPIIKDQLYEITAVLEDKGDDAFYI
jgi:uncharacterized protein with HEPN domain